MPKSTSFLLVLLASSTVSFAQERDALSRIPAEPLDIRAPRVVFTNDTLFASGGVTGRFENVTITAERLSGNPETGDIRLEGNIHFERDNVIWNGTELNYNYLTQTGDFGPSTLAFDPVLLSVDHIERVSTNEYFLEGATFTTCALDHPHYRVHVKEARLIDENRLKAKGATFYVGKVPVFYVPFWSQTLTRGIFTFRAGYGSEWGAYGLVRATVPLTETLDSITDVNIYTERGVGVGQGLAWDGTDAKGEFSSFYINDQDPTAKYQDPEITENRYRLKLENLQHFSETHYLNTKWNYLSDPFVLKEYFRPEYRSYAQPENYASWVYGSRYFGGEGFWNRRLNDFYDNTDRLEYSADLYRMRIGETPFYVQSENSVGYLEHVFSDASPLDNEDSVRLDSATTLLMPQRVGFLSVVPRASYRGTYYSKGAVDRTEEYRGIPGAGVEVSFEASKVLSDRERWYGKGLRHKIEPYLDYIYGDSTLEPNRLYRFDDVDSFGDENKVKLGLRNVLQTKREGRLSRFVDLDLYTHYLVDDDGSPDDFGPLFLDARMPLTARTMLDAYGEIDWNNGQVPFFDTRLSYRHSRQVLVSVEHLYWDDMNESLWSPRIDLYPDGDVSFFSYARYEDRTADFDEFAIGGYVNRCCMRYGLGYHLYDENEHTIMFSIGLSAFPEASISSGF